jgi:hypothetical protein
MKNDNSDLLKAMEIVNQWLGGQELLKDGENSGSPDDLQLVKTLLGTPPSISNDDSNSSNGISVTDVMLQKDTNSTTKNLIADTIFERLQTLAEKVGKQKDNIIKVINENEDVTIITEVAGYKISGNNVEIMNFSNKENKKIISADDLIRDLNMEIDKPKHKMSPDRGIMGVFDQLGNPQDGSLAHGIFNGKLTSDNNGNTR